jgi:hypothetical protein
LSANVLFCRFFLVSPGFGPNSGFWFLCFPDFNENSIELKLDSSLVFFSGDETEGNLYNGFIWGEKWPKVPRLRQICSSKLPKSLARSGIFSTFFSLAGL